MATKFTLTKATMRALSRETGAAVEAARSERARFMGLTPDSKIDPTEEKSREYVREQEALLLAATDVRGALDLAKEEAEGQYSILLSDNAVVWLDGARLKADDYLAEQFVNGEAGYDGLAKDALFVKVAEAMLREARR